eukprot:NODE_423_length_1391_cov_274.198212_g310_i0.p1 GENE.NODE_423_length_1391_cov_274.198212_g310_i0~~NODE_423_length_1391_cov_274.198212_g310_i0.p1  ORF type:complete len:268 (-),score=72.66 NODE_423_length_1391_cov_274.198212_g310_i0:479-1282(-)
MEPVNEGESDGSTTLDPSMFPANISSCNPGMLMNLLEPVQLLFNTPQLVPVVQNVVTTCSLGVPLDLPHIAVSACNTEYNYKQRPYTMKLRLRAPRITCVLAKCGRMTTSGAKTISDSRLGTQKCTRILQHLGYAVKIADFRVINMVALIDLKFSIQLQELHRQNSSLSSYETERFPAVFFKLDSPKLVTMVFSSGRVMLTGGKSHEDLAAGARRMAALCEPLRPRYDLDPDGDPVSTTPAPGFDISGGMEAPPLLGLYQPEPAGLA